MTPDEKACKYRFSDLQDCGPDCADGPDVDMVDILDAVRGSHSPCDVSDIELLRSPVKCEPDAVFQDVPCGEEYDGGYRKPYDRVDDIPSCEFYDNP